MSSLLDWLPLWPFAGNFADLSQGPATAGALISSRNEQAGEGAAARTGEGALGGYLRWREAANPWAPQQGEPRAQVPSDLSQWVIPMSLNPPGSRKAEEAEDVCKRANG